MKTVDLPPGDAGNVAQSPIRLAPEQLRRFDAVLGPSDQWPRGLRAMVSTLMACPTPMFIGWSTELTFLPNEAALDALGSVAINGTGSPLHTAFASAWSQIGPIIRGAQNGTGFKNNDLYLTLDRTGKPPESWWDLVCMPFSDDQVRVAGVMCLLWETTDAVVQKRAREEATAKLRAALATGDKIGTWDWDIASNRLRSDTPFALFYCVDPALAREGVPVEQYLACLHPDDRPLLEERVCASIASGETFHCEYRLIGTNGETHWISAQGSPEYDDNGKCVRFPGTSFDITLNKTKEARRKSKA